MPVASPPAFLQLAGHPLRWRLLGELAHSDRTVRELTGIVGEAQNLVSYHLGKLRDGRLVTSRRSSADGRDAYYSADLTAIRSLLSDTAAAVHPGLAPADPPADPPAHGLQDAPDDAAATAGPRMSVLFLCTGNSARSQMAEALVRFRSAGSVDGASAGSAPKPLHPNAVRAMREVHGIDISGQQPKHLSVFEDRRFDRIVTLCDRVREVCPTFAGEPLAIHWSLADPSAAGSDDDATYPAFEQTAVELDRRIAFLLADLSQQHRDGATRHDQEDRP